MEPERRLRHFVAAIAYRTQKALRDAPPEFANFRVAPGTRTPHELVRHIRGVLSYALGLITTRRALLETLPTFSEEIQRFHTLLEALAGGLAEDFELSVELAERLLQGPLADAMPGSGVPAGASEMDHARPGPFPRPPPPFDLIACP